MRRPGTLVALVASVLVGGSIIAESVRLRPMAPVLVDAKGGAIKAPEGVACRDRTVVISDSGNGRLLKFEVAEDVMTGGIPIDLPELPHPTRVALNSKGEIFALDSKLRRVAKVSAAGEFVEYIRIDDGGPGFTSAPRSIAVDRDDQLYVLDTYAGRITVLDREGKTIRQIGFPDVTGYIADIAVDGFGMVYAIDSIENRVLRAQKGDDRLTTLADGLPEDLEFPAGIAVGTGGQLFVTDQNGGTIVILGRDGEFKNRQSGMGWKPGRLRYPNALCTDSQGDLFVADRGNNRVQVFFVMQ